MRNVPHHLLDVANPKKDFNVAQYKKLAEQAVSKILAKGKLPIIVGGTGFYVESITEGIIIPDVAPNKKLRKKLDKKTTEELASILKKFDPKRYETIDTKNPRRLIRAIEIATALGKVPPLQKEKPVYKTLKIGLKLPEKILQKKIHSRLITRIRQGMVAEARRLRVQGLSWKRMEELGLEYRYLGRYLRGLLNKKEMVEELERQIRHYAKRQITWFKRNQKIKWFNPKDNRKIDLQVKNFLD